MDSFPEWHPGEWVDALPALVEAETSRIDLRVSQALETARARGLCKENVRTFYENLQQLYDLHKYTPDRIWNCDESGVQAGRNGGAVVIARRGAHRVQSIVPNQ